MTRLALNSPAYKRLQMLTIVVHTILIPVSLSLFFISCAAFWLWPVIALYIVFILVDPRAESGATLSPTQKWFRNSRWWKYFAAYYPVTLHKTVDLEPCFHINSTTERSKLEITSTDDVPYPPLRKSLPKRIAGFLVEYARWWFYSLTHQSRLYSKPTGKKYIFGYHPHGIIGMGVVGGVATDGADWSQLFPGIPVRLLTIANNFKLPIYREYLLGAGIASVSKQSCLRLLENGNPICIVVGGARESLLAEPGHMDLILAKRFGFIKIALQTGASLVPIIGFGENEIYRQAKLDGAGRNMHLFMTKNFGYTIPLFHARGIFNYDKGIIPYRHKIDVVVGRPVDVPKIESPTDEQVQKYHEMYVTELKKLFKEHKNKSPELEDAELIITDESKPINVDISPKSALKEVKSSSVR